MGLVERFQFFYFFVGQFYGKGAAHDFFTGTGRIHIGRIEEIDAQLEGLFDKGAGLVFVQGPGPSVRGLSVGHRAKTEAGNCHSSIAESDVFHKTVFPSYNQVEKGFSLINLLALIGVRTHGCARKRTGFVSFALGTGVVCQAKDVKVNPFYNRHGIGVRPSMLTNFLKVAWRNIVRGKSFTLINVSGLTIGMASALLILLWVQNELSVDRDWANTDRLYQVWNQVRGNDGIDTWPITPRPLGPALKREYPEIAQVTRVGWDREILFVVGDKRINLRGTMADPDFLTMFRFPFEQGDINSALGRPNDIVLTRHTAKILFGDADPMGKTVRLDNKYEMVVTGVMKDLAGNTDFDFEYVLPWTYTRWIGQDDGDWGTNNTHNYVLLQPHTNIAALNARIAPIYKRHETDATTQILLYPVGQLHLYGSFDKNGVPDGGKMDAVRVFMAIAGLILLIACINFMNMSTARSEKRAKEVGIRKVSGALRGSLIVQFLGESILLTAIAGVLAVFLAELCLPAFNTLAQKQLTIDFGDPRLLVFLLGFILFTGVVAGSYPAFFLSAFRPVAVLKGHFKKAHALVSSRKVLVVLQFSSAIILIICTLIIQQQVRYAKSRETGYDKQRLISVAMVGEIDQHYASIRQELLDQGIAAAMTRSSSPLTESNNNSSADWTGKEPKDEAGFNYFDTDGDIVKTAGLQLVQGRDIDPRHYPTDSNAVVLNESALKAMGFKQPIGQTINQGSWGTNWHVIGVVKDFVLESPYDNIKPMIFQGPKANDFRMIHIKLSGAHTTADNLAAVGKVFRRYNPQYPFEYSFVDEAYAKKFHEEQTTGTLTAFFAGLTIFISCLGLFGLAAYMAENRVKEIGVHKVLGASVAHITALLSKDFVLLVGIAILVASPVAWWSMHRWLAGYIYHVGISGWTFLLAGVGALLIALFTVSFQAIRAALANPATSLRSE
jgi:putative ABC transport system permease protein